MAWDILDATDQAEILALFPDQAHVVDSGTDKARPDFKSLMNDDTFRHDCATYTEHVAEGRFDPEWLAAAWAAHEQRKTGEFDDHLVAKFENDWQTDLPEDFRPRRSGPIAEGAKDPSTQKGDAVGGASQGATASMPDEDSSHEYEKKTKDAKTGLNGNNELEKVNNELAEPRDAAHGGHDMVIDELQTEEKQRPASPKTAFFLNHNKMDVDCSNSEDELA